MAEALRICFFGTYVTGEGYPINQVLLNGLRKSDASVFECHEELWTSFLHRAFGRGGMRTWPGIALRATGGYLRLIIRYLHTESHRVVIVGYPGYLDILLARLLNAFSGRFLVLVSFISLYDTIVVDRGQVGVGTWKAKLLLRIDRLAFACADLVLVDTREVADYFAQLFSLAPAKFHPSMVGNIFDSFAPAAAGMETKTPLKVLFFGTYVPLQGVEHIVEAATILRAEDIDFTLVGCGQLYESMRRRVEERQLKRVHLVDDWISTEGLVECMRAADVCLGIFGTTPKAGRVIPYKVFGALALRRPVITMDSGAVREMLVDGESALLCLGGSGESLAEALRRLRDEEGLAARIAQAGYERYQQCGSAEAIGRALLRELETRCGN